MNKIEEFVVEPEKILVGSTFLLKIRAIRYLSYKEIKNKEYKYFKDYKYKNMKGV